MPLASTYVKCHQRWAMGVLEGPDPFASEAVRAQTLESQNRSGMGSRKQMRAGEIGHMTRDRSDTTYRQVLYADDCSCTPAVFTIVIASTISSLKLNVELV